VLASSHPGGRDFGALVHAALQDVDFQNPGDIRGLCDFLAPTLSGNSERLAADAAAVVEQFLSTPRARQLAEAKVVRRELEFLLPWPPHQAETHGRYLHGYLDCLYQDAAGRWRLIDYKTNRAAAGEVSQVAGQYELQMLAYRLACEQALNQPLAECTLVLLHAGAEHAYRWTEAAERRGVEQITAAITALTTQL
jgi:ATP-dependent exoDNAse (exonuclease V) beta subunit